MDGRLIIFECHNLNRLEKIRHTKRFIENDVQEWLEELTRRRLLRARQAETLYRYGYERQGD